MTFAGITSVLQCSISGPAVRYDSWLGCAVERTAGRTVSRPLESKQASGKLESCVSIHNKVVVVAMAVQCTSEAWLLETQSFDWGTSPAGGTKGRDERHSVFRAEAALRFRSEIGRIIRIEQNEWHEPPSHDQLRESSSEFW